MTRGESSGEPEALAVRVRRFLAARFARKSELGLGLTLSLVTLIAGVSGFSGLLGAVLDNDALVRFDERVELWLRSHATAMGMRVFSVVTQLGSPVVVLVVVAFALYLWRTRQTL